MMKRLLVATSIVGVVTMSAMGATEDRSLLFGLQGGANFSNASLSSGTQNSVTGVSVGVNAQGTVVPGAVYLQPELNFIQKGSENSAFGGLARTRLNYLELPLLLKLKGNLGGIKPFVLAGPKVSYLLSANAEPSVLGATASIPTTDRFQSFDVGFDVGAGVGFALSENAELNVSARYSQGLIDIDKTAFNWKTQGFQALVGLLF